MSKESALSHTITRRRLLRSIAQGIIAVATTSSLPDTAAKVNTSGISVLKEVRDLAVMTAISTPLIITGLSSNQEYGIYPGSLEAKALKAVQKEKGPQAGIKFIDPDNNGPLALIQAVVFSDAHTLELAQAAAAYQWAQINNRARSEGGTLYLTAYQTSLNYLKRLQDQTSLVRPGTNIDVEADRRANYAVAAASAPHHSLTQAKLIGILPQDTPADLNVPQSFFKKGGYGREGNPIIYGVEKSEIDIVDGEPFEQGSERWGHVIYHAFLTSSYKYFKEHNLPLQNSIPFILRQGINYGRRQKFLNTLDQEATFISELTGWLYEIKTTFDSEANHRENSWKAFQRWFGKGKFYTNEGLLDTRLMEDIWANALGAELGLAKLNAALKGQNLEPIITQIDNSNFRLTGNGQQFLIPVGAAV